MPAKRYADLFTLFALILLDLHRRRSPVLTVADLVDTIAEES
jgi:hypothetical protein